MLFQIRISDRLLVTQVFKDRIQTTSLPSTTWKTKKLLGSGGKMTLEPAEGEGGGEGEEE